MRKVLIAATSLAACGGPGEGSYETEDGEQVDYDVDASGGESTFTVTDADGTESSITTGSSVEAELPAGISVYPGASVVSSSNVTVGKGTGSVVMMTSPDSPKEVIAHYKREAEAAGIVIENTMSANGMEIIGGKNADGLAFNVNAFPSEEGSTIQLSAGKDFDR